MFAPQPLVTRRQALRYGVATCVATLLAACGAPAAPTTAPASGQAQPPAAPTVAPTTAAQAQAGEHELVINSFGGSVERAMKSAFVEPFQNAFNATVSIQTSLSAETLAKLRAQKGNPPLDVAFMDFVPMTLAVRDDLIDTLDLSKIPNASELYPTAQDPQKHWLGASLGMVGLVYNTNAVKSPPSSWLDLWKPEYKGKVALPDISGTAGYLFLVAVARTQGGSERNIDPGFAKIRELKPDVLMFYKSPDQLVALLNQGDVVIAPWYNERAYAARDAGSPVAYVNPKEGGMLIVSCVGVPKGSKNKELAEQFINLAVAPDHQTSYCTTMRTGPTNKDVKLPPDVAQAVPYGDQMISSLKLIDTDTVAAQLPNWTDRWGREITG